MKNTFSDAGDIQAAKSPVKMNYCVLGSSQNGPSIYLLRSSDSKQTALIFSPQGPSINVLDTTFPTSSPFEPLFLFGT